MINLKNHEIFGLRLREWACSLTRISEAIQRTEQYEDRDYSPSKYTPSYNENCQNFDKLTKIISGYCIAVDDYTGRVHGMTEALFYQAKRNGLHQIKPYTDEELEYMDNDSGYPTALGTDRKLEADKIFSKVII